MQESVKLDLAQEVLTSYGSACLPVTGTSMFPCLQPADLLEIRRDTGAIQTGDIVVFEHCGRLVSHRVVTRASDRFITRGDRLRYDDAPVPREKILGRVVAIHRGGECFAPRSTFLTRLFAGILGHTDFATRATLFCLRTIRA